MSTHDKHREFAKYLEAYHGIPQRTRRILLDGVFNSLEPWQPFNVTSQTEAQYPTLTLERLSEVKRKLESVRVPRELKVTADECVPVGKQIFVSERTIIGIANNNEWPADGVEWDEIVVHPDRYEEIKAAVEGRTA